MEVISELLQRNKKCVKLLTNLLINLLVVTYFIFTTIHFYQNDCKSSCKMDFCRGYGSLVILLAVVYYSLAYYYILKPIFGKRRLWNCSYVYQ